VSTVGGVDGAPEFRDLRTDDLPLGWADAPDRGEDTEIVVLVVAGSVLAIGAVDHAITPGRGALYGLVVDPDHRGRGWGTALVGELERRAGARGDTEVYLEVEDPRAERLYERLGFRRIGTVRNPTLRRVMGRRL
jgi:ribosomal protein S18 acetylase RimI-like enzyme